MKLIVGLGNIGVKYLETRHNIGFVIIDRFLQEYQAAKWSENKLLKSNIASIEWKPKIGPLEKVVLAKPLTFMNNSGLAVYNLIDFYKVSIEDVWVIHDDIDLQLGALRIRKGGSSGGHRGIGSIISQIKNESFWRFRVGIGHPRRMIEGNKKIYIKHVDKFVLETFMEGEEGRVRELISLTSKSIMSSLEHGLEGTMNSFNTR